MGHREEILCLRARKKWMMDFPVHARTPYHETTAIPSAGESGRLMPLVREHH